MIIKEMNGLNIKYVAELEKECFSRPWSLDTLEECYCNPAYRFFISKNDEGKITGYISYYLVRDEGFLGNLAVTEEERGKGYGKALLEKAVKTAEDSGASFLTLEVRMSNSKAISLYEKAGFEIDGIRKNFYKDPDEHALILTKTYENKRPVCFSGCEILRDE